MNQYRKDVREFQSDYYWTLPRIFGWVFATMVLFGGGGWVYNLVSQPARIVSKTFDADNVLLNYEWFHDANANYMARVSQVKQFKDMTKNESDPQERSRLRIEMSAIQQSCRDLSRKYNANAAKINRGIFRGNSLPEQLNTGDCE